jgi:hypothetical protein
MSTMKKPRPEEKVAAGIQRKTVLSRKKYRGKKKLSPATRHSRNRNGKAMVLC